MIKKIFIIIFIVLVGYAGLRIFEYASVKTARMDLYRSSGAVVQKFDINNLIIPSPKIKLKIFGDIVFGRGVVRNMISRGPCTPFEHMSDWLKDADITFGNLENAVSDKHFQYPDTHTMRFIAKSDSLCGLKKSGIDVVSSANNHSMNYGTAGLLDTLDILNKNGIMTVGAGKNFAEAHSPAIIEAKGIKFAFLGYNSIVGGVSATESKPGLAMVKAAPWFPYSDADVKIMQEDIRAAKKKADVVIPIYHWGVEYKRTASEDQRKIAHAAVDAGADLIVGIHPHWVQGAEIYKDKLITYSLGNFIFDQSWSQETQEGVTLEVEFKGKKLDKYTFHPYTINSLNQPKFVHGDKAKKILNDLMSASWGL